MKFTPPIEPQYQARHVAEEHPFTHLIEDFGYWYSHTTTVRGSLTWLLYHTFEHARNPEHKVSIRHFLTPALNTVLSQQYWRTTTSPASGRHNEGFGLRSLATHLVNKAKRYPELKH